MDYCFSSGSDLISKSCAICHVFVVGVRYELLWQGKERQRAEKE